MKRSVVLYLLLVACLMAQAQFIEQAFVHTDKDCYLAGEDMWVKMYVTDGENHPTALSKVGYIEVCGTEHTEVKLKLALADGSGWGKVRIPVTVSTGVYRLSGYTRYMRNGGEAAFFKKQIAIINTFRSSETDYFEIAGRFEVTGDKPDTAMLPAARKKLYVTTDKKEYANRNKVQLSLQGLPLNSKDITVSVFRDDTLVSFPINLSRGIKAEYSSSKEWIPEYEGHIMTGHLFSKEGERILVDSTLTAGVAFVGKDLRFTYGRQDRGSILFNIGEIYGQQETVVSAVSLKHKSVRIDLQSPFCEFLPDELPVLKIYPDKELLQERSIGVQLQQILVSDSVGSYLLADKYYHLIPAISYDLDTYTRFPTLKETFIEFVGRVHVVEIDGRTVMQVLHSGTKKYSSGKALVILDGVPINDHEAMLAYNPYLIRQIDVYDAKFAFGGELFDSMVSFISHRGRLSGIRLGDEAQLVVYDCPHLKDVFESPVYEKVNDNGLRKPDFRHTLYWNPDVKQDTDSLFFYTSDLCGVFKIVVQALTDDGALVVGEETFTVK